MHAYIVGQPYNPNLKMPDEDNLQFNYRSGELELVAFIKNPSMEESRDYSFGKAEFGLYVQDDLIVLCFKFGKQAWADAPYSWHLVPEDQRGLPDPGDEGGERRRALNVILVNRANGRITGKLRLLTLSPDFTETLHQAIRDQAARPWPGAAAYDRQLRELYAQYPTSAALVRDCSVRCIGGS